MLQVAPAPSTLVQLPVSEKLLLAAMLIMVKGALPVLVKVTVCAALGVLTNCAAKVRLEGERVAAGTTPVPLRLATWAPFDALLITVRVAERAPVAAGLKVIFTVQLLPGAIVVSR